MLDWVNKKLVWFYFKSLVPKISTQTGTNAQPTYLSTISVKTPNTSSFSHIKDIYSYIEHDKR